MSGMLILAGLLLLLAALLLLWLRAFSCGPLWGLLCVLPPVWPVFILRHWHKARAAVLLAALSIIPLISGLVVLASEDSDRLHAILSLEWLKEPPEAAAELAITLRGQLHDQPFVPNEGELINARLLLRENGDFFARKEVSIYLPHYSGGALTVDVAPDQRGALPVVEIAWLSPDQELPEARRLSHGYTLHLKLAPQALNTLAGDFHLVLPKRYGTVLSGRIEVFTDQLRYKNEQVDRHYSSRDTLIFVLNDYFRRRFAGQTWQVQSWPVLDISKSKSLLNVPVVLNGQPQTVELTLENTALNGWQVADDHYPEPAKAQVVASEPVAAPPMRPQLDRRLRFSLQRLQRQPDQYRQLTLRINTKSGSLAEGRFVGIHPDGRLQLQRQIGGLGSVGFAIAPADIERIELLDP